MAKTNIKETSIEVLEITRAKTLVHIVGLSPLIQNRLTEKAQRELLLPARRKNRAEKESSLKHNPIEEYRASAYRMRDESGPTVLMLPGVTFKAALRSATADMPGASKAAIGRLSYIAEECVPIWGTPQLFMSVVRQGTGMNKVPDIRSRVIVPKWATRFEISFQEPLLTHETIAKLMSAAGEIVGVGDYRPEKGAGSYGRFRICSEAEFKETIKIIGGRKEQLAALESPECYNQDTEDLLSWFDVEAKRRGLKVA